MTAAAEPSLATAAPAPLRYFLATRPAFLSVTLGACLIGLASAYADGVAISAVKAVVTIVFAMAAHAGANVLNDYYDALSGNDAANTERIFPYTGGSRFIQNGVLTEANTLGLGVALFAATVAAGLWLMTASAPGLFFFGLAGVFIGVAYSAPPLALNSRGWGEACIWAAWVLVAAGTDYVQRAAAVPLPWIAAAGYALLVTDLLFINQFPDRRADEAVGKRHWVVRLGPERASHAYLALALAGHLMPVAGVAFGALPPTTLIALVALPVSLDAAGELRRLRDVPNALAPAIRTTIAATLAHGALVAAGLAAARLV